MKLGIIEWSGLSRVALILGEELIDLTAHLGVQIDGMWKFLAMGDEARALAKRCQQRAEPRLSASSVKYCSPIQQVDKVLGVGMNYHSFVAAARRVGVPISTNRTWFLRPRSCVTGAYDDIWLPQDANDLDYEAELAVVIGRRCRHVAREEAHSVVGGFTIANDLTLRERVFKSIALGKSFDTHTPLGPWIVTADEIVDAHKLDIKTWVNGELRQNSNTTEMIADWCELIVEVSAVCTLNPGDIILTGTPDGCGAFQRPPMGLAVGDVIKVEIEGIGYIQNHVVAEPPLS